MKDLRRSRLVVHQHDHHAWWSVGGGVVLPMLIAWAIGHPLGGFIMAVCLRIVIVLHSTFCVNSFAHTFGTRPYDRAQTARDNWIGALLTFCVFSFLYKDNPLYKAAEHLYVGISVGFAVIYAWSFDVYPMLVERFKDHGGQLRLPIIGTPFAPVRDKRFVEGLHRWEERWIHITRGVGNLHGVRINCPPEVSLLTLV